MGFRACIGRSYFYPIPIFGALSVIIIYAVYTQNSASMVESDSRNLRLENEELRRQLAVLRGEKGEGQPIGSLQPVTLTNLEGLKTVIESRIEKGESQQPWFQTYVLPLSRPLSWQQHQFATHGSYGFVQYSGYRRAADSFTLVGFTPTHCHSRSLQGCVWVGAGGAHVEGNISLHYEQEPFDMQYEAVVLECQLASSTGGGGGYLVVQMDNEEWVGYTESKSTVEEDLNPPEEFDHFLAYCSAGMHDAMVPTHFFQFIEFHRVVHSVAHFYLYDAGALDTAMRAVLAPLLHSGVVSITDLRSTLLFSVKMWGQPLAIQDCIQRTRYNAKWVMLIDPDEYLYATSPNTLRTLLKKHADMAWVTHGSFTFDIHFCERVLEGGSEEKEKEGAKEGRFIVENILMADPHVFCHHNKSQTPEVDCHIWEGHRKVIVNPRKVFTSGVHDVKDNWRGVHLNAITELRHFHYRGLSSRREETFHLCTQLWTQRTNRTSGTSAREIEGVGGHAGGKGEGEDKRKLVRNEEVAKLAALVRNCPWGSKEVRWQGVGGAFVSSKGGVIEQILGRGWLWLLILVALRDARFVILLRN